jgi:hypothetical protein
MPTTRPSRRRRARGTRRIHKYPHAQRSPGQHEVARQQGEGAGEERQDLAWRPRRHCLAWVHAHRQTSPESRDWLAKLTGTRAIWQTTTETSGHGSQHTGRDSARRIKARSGTVGSIVAALTSEPHHVQERRHGAEGEAATARALAIRLARSDVVVLHDRRMDLQPQQGEHRPHRDRAHRGHGDRYQEQPRPDPARDRRNHQPSRAAARHRTRPHQPARLATPRIGPVTAPRTTAAADVPVRSSEDEQDAGAVGQGHADSCERHRQHEAEGARLAQKHDRTPLTGRASLWPEHVVRRSGTPHRPGGRVLSPVTQLVTRGTRTARRFRGAALCEGSVAVP